MATESLNLSQLRAPRGSQLVCKGWIQEAALRMLLNNLDPEVAEDPSNLIVYGGTGKAARNKECLEKIIESLKKLENDETLLIQSGKPVGVFKTHASAPRVLLANSNLVGHWSHWDHFHEVEKLGLTMYGQMTAGSWIYIGTQGILQGTYETFAACGRKHFQGDLAGKWIFSGGLGGMGGAQPLAATLCGAVFLGVDVHPERVRRRHEMGYLDEVATSLDDALQRVQKYQKSREARSIGLIGHAGTCLRQILQRSLRPDIVTDQTSAHDELNGYVPDELDYEKAKEFRNSNPVSYKKLAFESMARHVDAMAEAGRRGSVVFDYGNNIRTQATKGGSLNGTAFRGFVPEYIRDLFCTGYGPFRWVALSGDPEDIEKIDTALLKAFPHHDRMQAWLRGARKKIPFQGLPARICWFEYGDRLKAGLMMNKMVADGVLKAPIVIGRDHLDCGSVASPYRETEAMMDGSDAIADWPILNALINTAGGASWVSVHNGGGVGIGYSLHAGMVIVADGTQEAHDRLTRVLTSDPGMGVIRHADAGYKDAIRFAETHGIRVPMKS